MHLFSTCAQTGHSSSRGVGTGMVSSAYIEGGGQNSVHRPRGLYMAPIQLYIQGKIVHYNLTQRQIVG